MEQHPLETRTILIAPPPGTGGLLSSGAWEALGAEVDGEYRQLDHRSSPPTSYPFTSSITFQSGNGEPPVGVRVMLDNGYKNLSFFL